MLIVTKILQLPFDMLQQLFGITSGCIAHGCRLLGQRAVGDLDHAIRRAGEVRRLGRRDDRLAVRPDGVDQPRPPDRVELGEHVVEQEDRLFAPGSLQQRRLGEELFSHMVIYNII